MWMALRGMELYPNPPGLRERGAGWDSSDVACAAILSCLMIIIWFDCFRYIVSQYGSRVKQGPQAGEVQVPRANEHFGLQGSEVLLKILHTDYFAELSSHRRRCGHSQDAALPWYSDSGLQAQIRLLAASTRILRWKRTTDFVVAKVRHEGVGYVGGGEWGSEGVREWGIERVREDGLLHLHIQPLETWSVGWSWSSMNSYPGLETWTPASKQGYFYSSLISVLPKVWYRSDPRCSHPLPPQWPAWASASVSGCSSWDYLAELDDQKLAVWHFY